MKTFAFGAAALLLAGLGGAGAARADVIYTFTTQSQSNNGNDPSVTGTLPLTIRLDLANAPAPGVSFALNGTGTGANPSFTGAGAADLSNLVSLAITTGAGSTAQGETITPSFLNGSISTRLNFNTAGLVSSTSLFFTGPQNSAVLTGTGVRASGSVGGSAGDCETSATSGICAVNGIWTRSTVEAVPEPATVALLAGALGLLGWRGRAGKRGSARA